MLPGHPCSGGNVTMPPTTQNVPQPESAQHQQSTNENRDSLLSSPRSRSQASNFDIVQKMNSILGNALNLTSFVQENHPITDVGANYGAFGESEVGNTPNRAVGAMRAIRGSGNQLRCAEPSDMTPIRQTHQLSDHLKSILARQSHGGDFGSLISPLPISTSPSTTTTSAGLTSSAAYHWPPFHVYQSPEISPTYLGGLNRIDYCALRDPMTWAPLPIAPPSSQSALNRTPTQIGRNVSPERSASTVSSSSSGLSMSHLTDLMAQLNTTDSPPPTMPYQNQNHSQSQQSGGGGADVNRSDWGSVYQLRHNIRSHPPPPPMTVSPPPPPIASSSTTSPSNNNDYAALLLAAANYFNNNNNNNNGNNVGGVNVSQCDPRYGSTSVGPPPPEMHDSNPTPDQQYSIERAARIYRKAATICDATCTWSGQLPSNMVARTLQNQSYSCKVFVGGVPWDITEPALLNAFGPFGPVRVEWPGKEARYAKSPIKPSAKGKGYVYMIYEHDRSVKGLLDNCIRDYTHAGEYYFQLTSRRLRTKEIRQVQIIPWNIGDSNHIRYPSQRLDPKKTVFVGALHGMITAEVLCNVLNDLFGGVVYAGIDTDKYKYPIGSGRVTFNNSRSYHKAIAAAFVEIKSAKFSKKVQIDPYLEDATCSNCLAAPGPYFCREFMCFRYFCKTCWHNQHALDVMQSHKPLMRNTRRSQQSLASMFPIGAGPQF